jgi:molybdopterin-guanine dinucleotide biosynthesis protein A
MSKKLFGLVLCGGQSQRMGRDKGLLQMSGGSWALNAKHILEPFCGRVFISVNAGQIDNYSSLFPFNDLILDSVETKGPITGILSAHKEHPRKDFLVLATDMIYMNGQVIRKFLDAYLMDKNQSEVFCFHDKDSLEPLCAIYRAPLLRKWLLKCKANALLDFSLHLLIRKSRVKYLEIPPAHKINFQNINTPESLN